MCLRTLRLKIGRLPDARGLVHRRDAEARRECEEGECARERVEESGAGGRSGSNLGGLATLRDEGGIFGANRGESNQVQAIAFHRRDAETRRNCEVEENAPQRVGVSGGTRRSGSNRERLEAKGLRLKADAGSRRESNQVQAIAFFLADAGSGARTASGTRGMRDRPGLGPNVYAGTPRCDVRVAERSVRRRNPPVPRVYRTLANSARERGRGRCSATPLLSKRGLCLRDHGDSRRRAGAVFQVFCEFDLGFAFP
jgi:hypothetical protein